MRAGISADRQEYDRVRDSRYSRDSIVIFKRNKAPPRGADKSTPRARCLQRCDVFCLRAVLALRNFESHALTFVQTAPARAIDCTKVHKHIGATFSLDKAIALIVVEPFDGPGYQLV